MARFSTLFLALFSCSIQIGVFGVPTIMSITPSTGIIMAGGLRMSVTGTELDTAAAPRLVISGQFAAAITVSDSSTGPTCTDVTATSMTCVSPVVNLTTYIDAGYPLSEDPAVTLINTIAMSFKMGVTFTAVTQWQDFAMIDIFKSPTPVLENSDRTYSVWSNMIAAIHGQDLDKYVNSMSDIDISLSNKKCPVQYLNSTYMWCKLPTDPPIPNSPDGEYVLVIMKIGSYEYQLGTIRYRVPVFSNAPDSIQEYKPRFTDSWIVINGTDVLYGLSTNNYKVQIGVEECVFITTTDTQIRCRGPNLQPAQLGTFPTIANHSQIVITVPRSTIYHTYVHHVGHVYYNYAEPVYDTTDPTNGSGGSGSATATGWSGFWRWILLGLALFVGILSCCCLFCCVFLTPFCRRRRREKEEEEEKDPRFFNRGGLIYSSHSSYVSRSGSEPRSYITRSSSEPKNSHISSYISKESESNSGPSRYFYVTEERINSPSPKRYFPK